MTKTEVILNLPHEPKIRFVELDDGQWFMYGKYVYIKINDMNYIPINGPGEEIRCVVGLHNIVIPIKKVKIEVEV